MRIRNFIVFCLLAICYTDQTFSADKSLNICSKMLYIIKDEILERMKPYDVTVRYNEIGEEIYMMDTSTSGNELSQDYFKAPAIIFIDTFGLSCEFIDTANNIGCVRVFNQDLYKLFPEIRLCFVKGIGTGKNDALAVAIARDTPTNHHSVYYFDIQGKNVVLLKKW